MTPHSPAELREMAGWVECGHCSHADWSDPLCIECSTKIASLLRALAEERERARSCPDCDGTGEERVFQRRGLPCRTCGGRGLPQPSGFKALHRTVSCWRCNNESARGENCGNCGAYNSEGK